MSTQNRAVLLIIAGVFGVSLSSIFGKLTTASGLVTAMYRMLFTALLLLPVMLAKYRSELSHVAPRDLVMSMLSGVFLGFHFATYLTSLKYTSVASSVVLVDTEVIFVSLFLFFFAGQRFPKMAVTGIVLAVVGSVLIAFSDSKNAAPGSNVLLGDALALLGAVCSSVYTLIGTSQRQRLSTNVYTFIVYCSAAVTLVIACLLAGESFTGYPVTDYLACLGMAVFCTLLGHSLFSYGLAYISAAFVSIAKLGEPVISALLAVVIFGEIPALLQVIGGLLVIGGIWLYLKSSQNCSEKSS